MASPESSQTGKSGPEKRENERESKKKMKKKLQGEGKEDRDDSWPGTSFIWQGRLVEP